jgi:hypothetical protein
VISLGIVVLTFWLGLRFFPLSSQLPGTIQVGASVKQINWNNPGSITSLLTTSLLLGGLVFVFMENIQSAIQKKLENAEISYNIYKDVYDRLMHPDAQAARRWVIQNIPTLDDTGNDKDAWVNLVNMRLDDVPPGWNSERPPGREKLKYVLNTLDVIGFVARHYWSMENERYR